MTSPVPHDACTRADRAGSPRALPGAAGQTPKAALPSRDESKPGCSASPSPRRARFFSSTYSPDFAEKAAIVLGYVGLALIAACELLGGAA